MGKPNLIISSSRTFSLLSIKTKIQIIWRCCRGFVKILMAALGYWKWQIQLPMGWSCWTGGVKTGSKAVFLFMPWEEAGNSLWIFLAHRLMEFLCSLSNPNPIFPPKPWIHCRVREHVNESIRYSTDEIPLENGSDTAVQEPATCPCPWRPSPPLWFLLL